MGANIFLTPHGLGSVAARVCDKFVSIFDGVLFWCFSFIVFTDILIIEVEFDRFSVQFSAQYITNTLKVHCILSGS